MAYWIGIDPGEHTGIAIWETGERSFALLATLPLHRALDTVRQWQARAKAERTELAVVFEDARQRKWFERERNASEYRGKLMGAGAAKRDARIWEEFLTDLGCSFIAHAPRPHTTKWPADYFARVTGYSGRTSEHARDAALLVFQKGKI